MGREVAIRISTEPFSGRFVHKVQVKSFQHCHLDDVGPKYLVLERVSWVWYPLLW